MFKRSSKRNRTVRVDFKGISLQPNLTTAVRASVFCQESPTYVHNRLVSGFTHWLSWNLFSRFWKSEMKIHRPISGKLFHAVFMDISLNLYITLGHDPDRFLEDSSIFGKWSGWVFQKSDWVMHRKYANNGYNFDIGPVLMVLNVFLVV